MVDISTGVEAPAFTWHSVRGGYIHHSHAVPGGYDVNGETMFVGRVKHEGSGDLIPGKIVPSHNGCYISYGGKEIANSSYQIMHQKQDVKTEWIHTEKNTIPTGAVQGGVTSSGETLFIGRHEHRGSWVIGKVHPSREELLVPFGGEEVSFHEYEILCLKPNPNSE